MKKVYIGVGHGGGDSGAVANGLKEKDLNLTTALECYAFLKGYCDVRISRTTDADIWLDQRIKEINDFKPDLAVDVHHNAGGGDGAECYHTVNGGKGKTLANNILKEVKKIGQNSRGAKTKVNVKGIDYFGFIRDTVCPAVIVECAFLDNKADVKIVDTKTEQQKMGIAIAKGILKTLGISVKKGDLNKDGVVNAKDALSALKIGVGKEKLTETAKDLGDMNGDGKVNSKDALEILKKSVGK